LGPQLEWKGLAGSTLHLKTPAVVSTDFRRIDQRGATAEVEMRWRTHPIAGLPATLTLSAQTTWATRSLQRGKAAFACPLTCRAAGDCAMHTVCP